MDDTGHTGFTLIELLLTVALVALLASLAAPAMSQLIERQRLRGAAEALAQELKQARNHALTHQTAVFFSLDDSARAWCYGWSDRAACDCQADSDCSTHLADSNLSHRIRSNDYPAISLSLNRDASRQLIQFSAIRATATAASFTLNNSAGELKVIVSPLGRVRQCSRNMSTYSPC
jgi:type IV fimbrial biogenesis protein FimT